MWSVVLLVIGFSCLVSALDEGCIVCDGPCKELAPHQIDVSRRGSLASPGYADGKGYPDNIQCSFQLRAPMGMHVRLKFTDVDIALSDACGADNLAVYDFTTEAFGETKGFYCGKIRPNDLVSTLSVIQIIFKSDDFATARGFNLSYSLQDTPDLCHRNQIQCMNRKCVSSSKVCDGNDDCEDGTDEEDCSIPDLVVKECGRREVDHGVAGSDRIVGGEPAPENSWPWMADLQVGLIMPNGHFCGGSLINAQWVVTAAHCFGGPLTRRAESVRVHLGNHHKFENDTYEQVRYGERIIIYDDIPPEQFEQDGQFDLNHDVALIKLNAPVQFTRGVKPVCLPDEDMQSDLLNPHVVCYHTGWGATRGTGYSDILKQAYHPIQNGSLCTQYEHSRHQFNSATMICAGSMSAMNGACHGDSGGPLACEINKEWNVFGVASYVTDTNADVGICGLENRPTVFNKIAIKTKWIRLMIQKYS